MNKPVLRSLLALAFYTSVTYTSIFAQSIKSQLLPVQEALLEGDLGRAQAEIDFFAVKYPKDPDVLLTKAGILYQLYMVQNPDAGQTTSLGGDMLLVEDLSDDFGQMSEMIAVPDNDESIYQPIVPGGKDLVKPLPADLVKEMAELLETALKQDNSRRDIHEALGYLYAAGLNKEALFKHLPQMRKGFADDDSLATHLVGLGQIFEERGDDYAALELYRQMAAMFPQNPTAQLKLGAKMYDDGRFAEAKTHFESALKADPANAEANYNLHVIHLISGEYDQSLASLEKLGSADVERTSLLFRGLVAYYKGQPNWKESIYAYLNANSAAPNAMGMSLARFLASAQYSDDFAGYEQAVAQTPVACYKLLLHQRAAKMFPDSAAPAIQLAECLSLHKNYQRALATYAQVQTKFGLAKLKNVDEFQFGYAWALQAAGKKTEADQRWKSLMASADEYKQSAAAYFHGKNLIEHNRLAEAQTILEKASNLANANKYTYFCHLLLANLDLD